MDQREPKKRRQEDFVDEDQKPRVSTNNGIPSPYMDPPPRYAEMVATSAARYQEYLSLVEQRNKLLLERMSYIDKHIDTKDDVEKLRNIDNQELMDVKIEPVKIEPLLLVDVEGSSQANSSKPRGIIKCCICKGAPATLVRLPCRHLCVCSKCDRKAQSCPICGTFKLSSSCT